MNRKITLIILFFLIFTFQPIFAETEDELANFFETTEEPAAFDELAEEPAEYFELAEESVTPDEIAEETEIPADVFDLAEEPAASVDAFELAEEPAVYEDITEESIASADDPVYIPSEYTPPILEGIRNNEFYRESLRLTKLAHDTFNFGDYDASAGFAQEAILYARLSDEYVAERLIVEAKRLLDWADANNIASRHPSEYNEGKTYYEAGVAAHAEDDLDESIASSTRSIGIFAALEAGRPVQAGPVVAGSGAGRDGSVTLPSQYTVRTWTGNRDCLWNIAGYSWVYGDPHRWRTLYEANRSKMPDPNNPNWIEPGMLLDIPSIRGEVRQGAWEPGRIYGTP